MTTPPPEQFGAMFIQDTKVWVCGGFGNDRQAEEFGTARHGEVIQYLGVAELVDQDRMDQLIAARETQTTGGRRPGPS